MMCTIRTNVHVCSRGCVQTVPNVHCVFLTICTFCKVCTIRKSVRCVFWTMCTIRRQCTLRIFEDVYDRYSVYILENVYNPKKRTLCSLKDVHNPYTVYTVYSGGGCEPSVHAYSAYSGICIQ